MTAEMMEPANLIAWARNHSEAEIRKLAELASMGDQDAVSKLRADFEWDRRYLPN